MIPSTGTIHIIGPSLERPRQRAGKAWTRIEELFSFSSPVNRHVINNHLHDAQLLLLHAYAHKAINAPSQNPVFKLVSVVEGINQIHP
ncbi:hypothetical protein VTO42DRAFT_7867 [Malbranchea cinnamomea]